MLKIKKSLSLTLLRMFNYLLVNSFSLCQNKWKIVQPSQVVKISIFEKLWQHIQKASWSSVVAGAHRDSTIIIQLINERYLIQHGLLLSVLIFFFALWRATRNRGSWGTASSVEPPGTSTDRKENKVARRQRRQLNDHNEHILHGQELHRDLPFSRFLSRHCHSPQYKKVLHPVLTFLVGDYCCWFI